ncbi:MAG: SIS domain-containing protein [Erysipelotrichaceae bacterium]|nr:SIS domain-containing protein [Erysipelotrichaceae bacterium]
MEKTMLDYIKESPGIELDIIDNSSDYTRELTDFCLNDKGLCFIASGSSYNACLCARYFMQHVLGMEIRLVTPFTFLNHDMEYLKDMNFIGVSQSGCSTNTLNALQALKDRGIRTACLTGRKDCDASDITDLLVDWHAGEEKIGFVTKGVSTLTCFLMCFAVELALKKSIIGQDEYIKFKDKLRQAVNLQPEMMDNTIKVFNERRDDFISPRRVIILSSGPNLGTATEGALKMSETSCITAMACEAEEFLHGPLYPSTPDDLIILIDNNKDACSERIIDIANALKDITDKVYLISNTDRFDGSHCFSTSDQTCSCRSPLYRLTCLQTLSYLMTEATNRYEPHEAVKTFKKANKVASKSRSNLYLNLQKID